MIKPDLNQQYQQLCNDQVPITSWLFGDELAKTCQDITNTNRVSQKVSGLGSHRPHRQQKYRRHYHHPKKRAGEVSAPEQLPTETRGQQKAATVIEKPQSKVSALNMLITGADKCFKVQTNAVLEKYKAVKSLSG